MVGKMKWLGSIVLSYSYEPLIILILGEIVILFSDSAGCGVHQHR